MSLRIPRRLLIVPIALLLALQAVVAMAQLPGMGPVVQTQEVRAELLAQAPQGVAAGAEVWLGLQLTHQPGWHTYWKNPGDSGLPTTLAWTLPPGWSADDIAWPLPRRLPVGPLMNYGYEGQVLLPVRITIGPDFKPPLPGEALNIELQASWLVCKTECIPQDGKFALKLTAQGSTALHASLFQAALAAQPRTLAGADHKLSAEVADQRVRLRASGLPAAWQGKDLTVFAELPELLDHAAEVRQSWNAGVWQADLPLSRLRSTSPSMLPVVLAQERHGLRFEVPVTGQWPAVSTQAAGPSASPGAPRFDLALGRPQGMSLGFVGALLGALLGGLILNLMPCVFPILAIKVSGFAHHAQDRRRLRLGGMAYTFGVLSSFLLLGLLLLALRSAGQSLGWGFQLQEPWMIAALALLFTLIGLNLAGLFEFGSVLPSGLATLQARHPAADAFLTGVLAVAVASPCTAPFMGASVGLAIDLPAGQALAVFASVGLGLALPFLLASFMPGLARALPRPGPWMVTTRRLLAFPIFATVAWLVWVLGQQSGIDGAGALLLLLVLLSALLWALGQRGAARTPLTVLALALSALGLWGLAPYIGAPAPQRAEARETGPWLAWRSGRVEELLARGQPVFVDFTAAWCVTCQFNKQAVLSDASLLADLQSAGVVLLRADWTRRDSAITATLAQLGRNGIPVYVLYRPGKPPQLLPELLRAADVRAALSAL